MNVIYLPKIVDYKDLAQQQSNQEAKAMKLTCQKNL
jgi:hypothetical protein